MSAAWPGALRKGIEVLLALREKKTPYVSSYLIAEVYADSGDKDHAFEWLDIAAQDPDPNFQYLPVDQVFNSLRSDPRYTELLRKVGFPQ